jgi:hypothetical protein
MPDPEPEPEPEPEPLPEPEPEPVPEPAEPEPEPLPAAVAEVIPLAAPEPEPKPEPEDLPDFIVIPGAERRPGPSEDDGFSTLGFRPVTELIFEPQDDTEPRDDKPRTPRERPADDRRAGNERRKRSNHEPGDEGGGTDWMQGLSSRLSAYSLSEESPREDDVDEEPSEGDA